MQDSKVNEECDHEWVTAPNDSQIRFCGKCGLSQFLGTEKEMEAEALDSAWRLVPYRVNVYQCKAHPKHHHTTTVDVHDGTTTFTIGCTHKLPNGATCGSPMRSWFYPTERPVPKHVAAPTFEWYRPPIEDLDRQDYIAHVENGGLLLRPIETPQIKWLMHERPSKVNGHTSSKTDEQRAQWRSAKRRKQASKRRNRRKKR